MANSTNNVSATIPEHIDRYLDMLCQELKVSKSGLICDLVDLGLTVYVSNCLSRHEFANTLKNSTSEADRLRCAELLGKEN